MSECSTSLTAERPQLAGRLPEGDAAPAPAHHDHDEDGSLPSGESTSLIYRCSTQRIHSLQVYLHVRCNPHPSQTAAGYTIPVGHQVCVSPTVNHRLGDAWEQRLEFKPDRYLEDNPAAGEKFAYIPFGAGKRGKSLFQVFLCKNLVSSICFGCCPQAATAASGRTLPTSRLKPSGRLCCACTNLTWWTVISPPSTTPR